MKAYNYQGLDKLQNDILSITIKGYNKGISADHYTVNMGSFKFKKFLLDVNPDTENTERVEVKFDSGLEITVCKYK